MRERDGSEHRRHQRNIAPNRIDVVQRAASLGFRIDPADSEHDDQPGIDAVLADAATTAGSTVWFPDGTYNLLSGSARQPNAHIVLVKSGVNLEGQSRERTILKSGFDDQGRNSVYGMLLQGVHDVVIANLTVTSSWNRNYSTDSRSNNPDAGGLTYSIATSSAGHPTYNVTIDNVLVEKFRRMGVRIGAGSHDIVVTTSLARNATDVGGGGAGYGFVIQGDKHKTAKTNPYLGRPDQDTYFVVLDGNRTDGPYIRHAVIIQYWAHNNLVTRNTFEGTQLDAIDLHGEDEYANEVSHNTVIASQRAGIGLGNSGATHDKTGVDNWIHHNELTGCAWGITVQYGTERSTIEHNLIRDNTALAHPPVAGVILGNSSNSVLRNNRFVNNTVEGFSAIVLKDDRAMGDEAAGGPRNWTILGNSVINSGTPLVDTSKLGSGNVVQPSW
ncbi:right-handed parallel beta-helix repeat-containing protein [Piscinibacter sakaiensis]|uniref:right-handed parallel beta-helix repeat-containing protein n=1 Tax=Piscinibacter sakaiensis TaxID=1547922 RepID=UPI003AAD671E